LYYSFYLLVLVVVFCVYMCWCCVYTRIKIYIYIYILPAESYIIRVMAVIAASELEGLSLCSVSPVNPRRRKETPKRPITSPTYVPLVRLNAIPLDQTNKYKLTQKQAISYCLSKRSQLFFHGSVATRLRYAWWDHQ